MSTENPPTTRRPRPHPAQRARKVAGAVSVASMLLLTGCMFAATKTATPTRSATAATTVATTPIATNDDDSSSASRSVSVAAVAGTVSAQAITSTHAS